MPCCGKSTSRSTYMGIPGSPRFGPTGVIELRSLEGCTEPDCITPYQGEHRTDVAYLVGWNTEHEKLFRGRDSKVATGYANEHADPGSRHGLRIDRIMLTELPIRAIRLLYAD